MRPCLSHLSPWYPGSRLALVFHVESVHRLLVPDPDHHDEDAEYAGDAMILVPLRIVWLWNDSKVRGDEPESWRPFAAIPVGMRWESP